MASVTPESVLKEIKAKKFHPVYFLHGDEPYFIDRVAAELETKVIPESARSFNQFVLYGKDHDLSSVIGHAKRFPFMFERQLIMVKEAHRLNGIDQKEQQKWLEDYVLSPLQSTVLVFCFQGNADERKSYLKTIAAKGILMQSKKLYDNKLPDWIGGYCQTAGVKISPKAIQMLADNIGNDLKRLAGEIDKMMINLKAGEGIDAGIVEKFVGISKEYNIFELQKALSQRDVLKANTIIRTFAANTKENPLAGTVAMLYTYFCKVLLAHVSPDKTEKGLAVALGVNPFFTKDYMNAARNYPVAKLVEIIHILRMTDAKMKGVDGGAITEQELYKELVFSILH